MQKNVLIIGYGASGKSAEVLLKKQGYITFIYDDKPQPSEGFLSFEQIKAHDFSCAVLSPGISLDHPVCHYLKSIRTQIFGEAQYALKFLKQRMIAITGTNGKTTVTYLCEHILRYAGYNALACGNVSKEKALSTIALNAPDDAVLVIELSSFQLETLQEAYFESGIVLNISPDHLDRYPSMVEYAKAKLHLEKFCEAFFVHKDVKKQFPQICPERSVIYDIEPTACFLGIQYDSYIDLINTFSAYLLLKSFDICDEVFLQAVLSFQKPKHRLEKVAEISGVEFINDSKATNIDATIQALRSMKKPVILLAGGFDKGYPYSPWIPHLHRVKHVVCFGAAKDLIYQQISAHVPCTIQSTLAEAVINAYDLASHGDIVLLSPGCSSFDAFKDYQDRGEQFCQNALNLKTKEILL